MSEKYILLTKKGCQKCEYVKANFELDRITVIDIDNPMDNIRTLEDIEKAADAIADLCMAGVFKHACKSLPLLLYVGIDKYNTYTSVEEISKLLSKKRG